MKLYNTLTRKIEEFAPQTDTKIVSVYTCGPTVYDYPHAGNWFTFIRYDLLVRTIRSLDYTPKWVMNLTDVGHLVSDADEGEDKLEKGARREGKTAWDVATFYGNYFEKGLGRLNISMPTYLPKATEHIAEQIALIKVLEAKGFTYVIDDGVYYDTAKFPKYTEFAHLDADEQQAGKRVEFNQQKRGVTDFALWKFSPSGQTRDMEWDSPWGKGFPGWHLECSAMSMKYLGDTLDVHSGGIDHIPVHHTNEIAQSEAATGKQYSRFWMHTNHITVNGEKISKSLGNSITLEDIEAKGHSLMAFRLHVLESHYRSQSKFSWESLEAAENRLKKLYAMAVLRYQAVDRSVDADKDAYTSRMKNDVHTPLLEDLNTPAVLTNLSAHETDISERLVPQAALGDFEAYLHAIDELLGLNLMEQQDITESQKALLAEREQARATKDWAKSDEIRNQLKTQKIEIRDTPHGTIWYWQ